MIIDMKKIDDMIEEYRIILNEECSLSEEKINLDVEISDYKNTLITEGYENGKIKGSNNSTRDRSELNYIQDDILLKTLNRKISSSSLCVSKCYVNKRIMEARISLTKAMLYSQSGHNHYVSGMVNN